MLGSALKRSASSDRLAPATPQPLVHAAPAAAASVRQPRRLALRFRGCGLGLPVPSEMWGAAALAVRMAQPGAQPQLHRAASAVIAQAFSAAATPPPSSRVSEDHPKALAEALEWRPRLSAAEEALSLVAPAAACAGVYAVAAPPAFQPLYAAAMALLYALLILATRMLLTDWRYKAIQRSERELAASDSCFFQADGIHLHYKRRAPAAPWPGGDGGGKRAKTVPQLPAQAQPPAAVVHCLHGFGASSYSWSFVQQELADALHAVVTAHDMPGFGLSQRPRSPHYYTLHFNGQAARRIIDAELAQQAQQRSESAMNTTAPPAVAPQQQWELEQWDRLRSHPIPLSASSASLVSSSGTSSEWGSDLDSAAGDGGAPLAARQQQQPKRVLIGHSMGGAAVAEGVIAEPEGVAALVLVAPAIVALWLGPPEGAAGNPMATGMAVVEELVSAEDAPGELQRTPSASSSSSSGSDGDSGWLGHKGSRGSSRRQQTRGWARRTAHAAVVVVKALVLLAVRLALAAATPLMLVLLRRLVRARGFWERGLISAWHDGSRVTREYVDNYRSGQLVRGWEGGILRFLAARFGEKAGFWGSLREAIQGEGHLTQAERLAAVVRRHGIRVLIVHGASDALVPVANSRRLASLLPNAELAVFEQCGHMPQEECPERFVETVRAFLQSATAPSR